MRIILLKCLTFLLIMYGWGAVGQASDYPNRNIRVIVGPGIDTPARIIGDEIAKRLHTQVIVESKPLAGGALAMNAVATAAPDGYTMLLATAAYTINTAIGRFQLDLRKEFAPVAHVADVKYALVVNSSVPVNSFAELLAYAKANPGKLNYASVGIGTPPHMAGEMLKVQAGIDIVHVPFRDTGSAVTGLLGGNVQMMFLYSPLAEPQIKRGLLKGMALSAIEPSSFVPDIKPLAEQGVPNFDVVGWYGFVVPKGTPQEAIQKLSGAIQDAIKDPDVTAKILKSGFEPAKLNSPDEFRRFIDTDTEKWIELANKIGLKVQP
jgi:tripartite-type tricarboxylate transporter receptor subunit TctC